MATYASFDLATPAVTVQYSSIELIGHQIKYIQT